MARLILLFVTRRFSTLTLLALMTLVACLGVSAVYVQDSWINSFARDSQFRRDTDRVNAALLGTHLLLVHLAFDPPAKRIPEVRGRRGPLLDPTTLEAIGTFESFLRSRPEVGGVLGIDSHLTSVAYLAGGRRREGTRSIPDDPVLISRLLKRFDQGRGEWRRRQVIDDELRRTVVTIFLKHANYQDTDALMKAIRAYETDHLAPLGARLDFAGDVAVSQAMIPAIVRTQVTSLFLAVSGAFLTVCVLYRSVRTGFYALLPTSIAVVWVFGLMGWLEIPLGVATSMFCAITLGTGVDFAIHFLERLRKTLWGGRPDPVSSAIEEAGPAIGTNALAIVLGFGLLAISKVPANARLGLLVAASLTASSVLTLVGLATWLAKGRIFTSKQAL